MKATPRVYRVYLEERLAVLIILEDPRVQGSSG
jgi:hypothetical protein